MTEASDGRRRSTGRSRRAAVLVSVVVALGAPSGALPTAGAAVLPRVGGTTIFTASANATATVHVPRAATLVVLTGAQSPNVTLSGAGRFFGFTLTAVRRADRRPPTLVAMQTGLCAARACRPAAPHTFTEYVAAFDGLQARQLSDGNADKEVTLPAGDYIVRAVTDGTTVRMVLRLSGLSGSTSVNVARRFTAEVRTDSSTAGVAAGVQPLRNLGVTHNFASDLGLMMHVMFVNYDPHVRSAWGYCIYRGDATPTTGYYHPQCPNGTYGFWVNAGQPTLQYRGILVGSDIALERGRWTRGYYAAGVGAASSLTVASLWVDLT